MKPDSEVSRVTLWKRANPEAAREIQRRADRKHRARERLLRELLLHPPTETETTDTE